ncbi:MAG: hypothetical protein ACAI25_11565 [Planctomycetota bacterium]
MPAILEALREVTPETKARIDSSLAGFARGKVIPTESADRAIEWWMQNYPADFEE